MSGKRGKRRIVLIVVVILAIGAIVIHLPVPPPKLRIGPETTVIDGPLNADGTVNYLAAVNAETADGVTPDNNAAVLLVRAFGRRAVQPAETRPGVLKELGLESLPWEGDHFVSLEEWARRLSPETRPAPPATAPSVGGLSGPGQMGSFGWEPAPTPEQILRQRLGESARAPWDPKERPKIARWLDENAAALDLVAQAGRRSRCYLPMVSLDDPPSFLAALYLLGGKRETDAMTALTARAMRRAHAGQTEAAWSDILAVWRLGRLRRRRATLLAQLIGVSRENLASRAAAALAGSGKLTAEQARSMLADLEALPPSPDMVDGIDRGERFVMLDAVMMVMRGVPIDAIQQGSTVPRGRPNLDPNEMLRVANGWYDRMVAANRNPTEAERVAANEAFLEDYRAVQQKAPAMIARGVVLKAGGWPCRKALSRQVALVLVSVLVPNVSSAVTVDHVAQVRSDLARIALALAGWRAEKGEYPEQLTDLSPGWLKEIPPDWFTGKDLIYKRTAQGYLLYSVGPDGDDDGGLKRQRHSYSESYDIVVRVPAADRPSGSTP